MTERKRTERTTRETKAQRPDRIPVGGHRDILTVQGKKEDFYYRWVLDTDEGGPRILRFLDAGYEFVGSSEVRVGQPHVYQSENVGSIVRRPAGADGYYLYLMCLPMDLYQEDQLAKQRDVDTTEESLYHVPESLRGDADEVYGSFNIKHDTKLKP